ncbi:GGDEF domain-containing protein [Acinetobacter sp. MD2]|uniref:GGDEF domain-containing protein n=1 Tax=Acinetobacter sp. MD2 TaxID=2600066 RepID=UPI002D1E5644|nr:GGDEF domain-containing protein [Acinetobacter sp. MD2]MEB3767300.1 GGDEF domain-containing protein [Acinetobacter sp. MD2]
MLRRMAHQTLAEQLEIGEFEILHRKELLQFTPENEQILMTVADYIDENLEPITEFFYQNLLQTPSLSIIVGDIGTLNKLKLSLRGYIQQLFQGTYDLDYVNSRLRIGLVHKRVNVSPNMYLSALILLKHYIFDLLEQHLQDAQQFKRVKYALDKLLCFDEQLVFDTYFYNMLLDVRIAHDQARSNEKRLKTLVEERTKQLYELSNKDALTNLWNRRYFVQRLRLEIENAQAESMPLSLFYMDLNGFKAINDVQGHHQGDLLLKDFAQHLMSICRHDDVIARMGGDEFVWLISNMNSVRASQVAVRIAQWKSTTVSVSIGVVCIETYPITLAAEAMLEKADQVMYQAKNADRSRSTWQLLQL